jgi:hypothetical protein
MSLANIQHLVLNLTIDPNFADRFYADPKSVQTEFGLTDQEVEWASQIPQHKIEDFQTMVSSKRSRRAENFFLRTHHLLSSNRRKEYLRGFARQEVMRVNQWHEKAYEYMSYVQSNVRGKDRHDAMLREVIEFEKWLYTFTQEEFAEKSGTGYVVAPNVRVQSFPFPAEPLITEKITSANMELLVEGYGETNGYVLAQKIDQLVDLYEIDECYYNLISQSETSCSLAEITERADRIAKELGLEKNPQDMIAELQEFGILIVLGEEN